MTQYRKSQLERMSDKELIKLSTNANDDGDMRLIERIGDVLDARTKATERIPIRISRALKAQIRAAAKSRNQSASDWLREAAIERLERERDD